MEINLTALSRQVRIISCRTDNCIKNHFYSTLRRSLRRINKFVGIRNSTEKMREIKPSILSKMLDNSINS